MTNVWRLNIKTAAAENVNPRKFCIDNNILGVGWPVDSEEEVTWDIYYKLGEEEYYNAGDKGWWPAVNAVKNRMQKKRSLLDARLGRHILSRSDKKRLDLSK